MTLLTIVQELALNVGLPTPTDVASSTDRSMQEALDYANETGEELARRVDWGDLTGTATLTGDGSNKQHDLPAYFSRLVRGVCVAVSGAPVRPLSRAEWATLIPYEGTPRYFLLEGGGLTLWPYLADAATVTAIYQSKAWCSNGTDSFTADDETSLIDEELFAKGLIVRWRRQKGMSYADEEAEYEAALRDYAGFDDRNRIG